MPSLETARRIASVKNNGAKTIGQIHKENSDWVMDYTWESDLQSKKCYIYDYFHDDQPDLNVGMTYENTTKTLIDAKFIIKSYQSMDKDQVDYYLQFRPSQPVYFAEEDELYYYETDFRFKYNATFPVGLYVDVPDDRNIYHKYLICREERANQFPKYLILPCDYHLHWIEHNGKTRIKRKMWAVLRMQSSYTIGEYRDRVFARTDNQNKIWLPINSITEKFWYTNDENTTMRLIVSAPTEHPLVWSCTKIENVQPFGIQKLTIYQTVWSDDRDYIERDDDGNIIGMWASYYDSKIEPEEQPTVEETDEGSAELTVKIAASTFTIKTGGSYKTLTASVFDEEGNDKTNECLDMNFAWRCFIENSEYTDKAIWRTVENSNQIKLKLPSDMSLLGKILKVQCIVNENVTSDVFELEIK